MAKKAAKKKAPTKKTKKKKAPARKKKAGGVDLNHAMVYSVDVPKALRFYRDQLGLEVIEQYGEGYARLKCSGSSASIGLHGLEAGQRLDAATEGLRLYFEVADLDAFCEALAAKGVVFESMPADMPWGWRHAYLRDPDGHQLSLYRAGAARLRPTVMR